MVTHFRFLTQTINFKTIIFLRKSCKGSSYAPFKSICGFEGEEGYAFQVFSPNVSKMKAYYEHPTDNRVSAPVTGFSPFNVGFLQMFRTSNIPIAASVKSAFSRSAPSKLVPVKTALLKIAPRKDDP